MLRTAEMDLFRLRNRKARGFIASQGAELTTEDTPHRSLTKYLFYIETIPRILATLSWDQNSSRRNKGISAPSSIPHPTASVPDTSKCAAREVKIEVIDNPSRRQADLETEIRELRKTIAEQDAKLQYYQSEPYRNEVLSIRRHLRVAEEHEPWRISQMFTEITGKVESISGELSELLLPLQPVSQPTARSLFERLRFVQEESQLPAKHISRHSVRPDEYVDFGCRALINQFLMDIMFNAQEFHPSLNSEENHVLYSRYKQIRVQDPQVIAGHWRVSTIESLRETHKDHALLTHRFFEEILKPFCSNIYNLESLSQTLDPITSEFFELLKLASDWRSFTDRSVVMYDFHPQFLEPGAEFNIHEVEIEGARSNTLSSNKALLTTRLGLHSSRTLGDSQGVEIATQSKICVLTSEYFVVEAEDVHMSM
ncbi:hypothetical protein RSOLAG22IIIB_13588 [Rhizoctonia solani]|uniref:Uncharacterized protein n=1 Tax=Rhizoctonia solani TaxID=456999 RepID=A0A0K6FP45_9AGAM|nr:hypothetical protein RSOLAG22IIIB_13588 [Rhizoctonia solani]